VLASKGGRRAGDEQHLTHGPGCPTAFSRSVLCVANSKNAQEISDSSRTGNSPPTRARCFRNLLSSAIRQTRVAYPSSGH
jgi:hypothetical protein